MLEKIKKTPQDVEFQEVISYIDSHFIYRPTAFKNGGYVNQAGQNEGSCKILTFAKIYGLNERQTLHCFGKFYREDVLSNLKGSDHQNIRRFMAFGWDDVYFDGAALLEIS